MSKKEIKDYFQWFMDILPQRLDQLTAVVKQTPGFENWLPDCTADSLDALGEWFAGQVEKRNRTEEEIQTIKSGLVFPMDIPGEELTNRTYSLSMDIGMYLSQVLLKNHPSLKWDQVLSDKKFADYGQPLLTGFGPVPLNPIRIGHVIANGLASKNKNGKRLREIYDYWAQRVQP
jgi:hypothetical protein